MGLMICSKKDDACPKDCEQGAPQVCHWVKGCDDTMLCFFKGVLAPCVPVDAPAGGGEK